MDDSSLIRLLIATHGDKLTASEASELERQTGTFIKMGYTLNELGFWLPADGVPRTGIDTPMVVPLSTMHK